jgi:hypothetical protein
VYAGQPAEERFPNSPPFGLLGGIPRLPLSFAALGPTTVSRLLIEIFLKILGMLGLQ